MSRRQLNGGTHMENLILLFCGMLAGYVLRYYKELSK
nr:MAG TPA_asm: hypothetical protein [Caudoviricetes sp.]